MNSPQIFIAVSIAILAVLALLVFAIRREERKNRLTPLAGLAFALIVAGILFGAERLIGYVLMGVGILLAVVDIFVKTGKG